jgi:hypothetical protein
MLALLLFLAALLAATPAPPPDSSARNPFTEAHHNLVPPHLLFPTLQHPSRTSSQTVTGSTRLGDFSMDVDFSLHHGIVLDTHAVHSMEGDGTITLTDPEDAALQVGSFIFGSHAGAWNSHLPDGSRHRRILRGATEGITLARRVVSVSRDHSNNKLTLKTVPSHPQEAVKHSKLGVQMNMTRDVLVPHRDLEGNRRLSDWCEDACKKHDFWPYADNDEELTMHICHNCFEYEKRQGFVNYNYDDDTNGAKTPLFNIGNAHGVQCKNCYVGFYFNHWFC